MAAAAVGDCNLDGCDFNPRRFQKETVATVVDGYFKAAVFISESRGQYVFGEFDG